MQVSYNKHYRSKQLLANLLMQLAIASAGMGCLYEFPMDPKEGLDSGADSEIETGGDTETDTETILAVDDCPDDPEKTEPGLCGCGVAEGTCGDPLGTGLKGTYFNNSDFTEEVLVRIDPFIDFNWNDGSPIATIGADTFSIRWTGHIQAELTNNYTFYTVADNGVHLWVDNRPLISNWSSSGDLENQATIFLKAGVKYPLIMEYFENTGPASAQLLWSSADQPKEIIPREHLFPGDPAPDQCPFDSSKIEPGLCGCGTAENVCDDSPDQGLKGVYFKDVNLTEQAFVRIDPTIDFDWKRGSPDPEIPCDYFSVRWTGRVTANSTETYTFYAETDDGVRLWVNDQLLIDEWLKPGEKSAIIPLVAGESVAIKIEYNDNLRNAVARLLWSSNSVPKEIIPAAQLSAE